MVCSLCLNNLLPFRIFGIESFQSYSVLNLISFTKMQISVKIIRKNISWSHNMKLDFTIVFFFFLKGLLSFIRSRSDVFCKKGGLKNFAKFSEKDQCQSLFFNNILLNFIKKETLAQVFSCEYCKIIMSTFFWNTSGDCF